MKKETYSFEFTIYKNKSELDNCQREILEEASRISHHAYAPYSNFKVGTAVKLENGEVFSSSNQENASYPVGTCAERGLLAYVNANFPNLRIEKLAVYTPNINYPLPPCGMCRQYILEIEKKQDSFIEILLSGNNSEVFVLNSSKDLLPLHFNNDFLG